MYSNHCLIWKRLIIIDLQKDEVWRLSRLVAEGGKLGTWGCLVDEGGDSGGHQAVIKCE